jgi:hypothetical protein
VRGWLLARGGAHAKAITCEGVVFRRVRGVNAR